MGLKEIIDTIAINPVSRTFLQAPEANVLAGASVYLYMHGNETAAFLSAMLAIKQYVCGHMGKYLVESHVAKQGAAKPVPYSAILRLPPSCFTPSALYAAWVHNSTLQASQANSPQTASISPNASMN
jgi:hypothetical protein